MNDTPPVTSSKERNWLIFTWFGFFLLNGIIILFLYLLQWIERDTLLEAMKQWSSSYGPYIGAITLFYWGSASRPELTANPNSKISFYLALICSLLWNLIILLFNVQVVIGNGTIEEAVENIRDIGSLLSWLVAGAMGYYFANSASAQTSH